MQDAEFALQYRGVYRTLRPTKKIIFSFTLFFSSSPLSAPCTGWCSRPPYPDTPSCSPRCPWCCWRRRVPSCRSRSSGRRAQRRTWSRRPPSSSPGSDKLLFQMCTHIPVCVCADSHAGKSGVVSTALEIDKKLEIISTKDNLKCRRQIDNKK